MIVPGGSLLKFAALLAVSWGAADAAAVQPRASHDFVINGKLQSVEFEVDDKPYEIKLRGMQHTEVIDHSTPPSVNWLLWRTFEELGIKVRRGDEIKFTKLPESGALVGLTDSKWHTEAVHRGVLDPPAVGRPYALQPEYKGILISVDSKYHTG